MTFATQIYEDERGWAVKLTDLFDNIAVYREISKWIIDEGITFRIANMSTLLFDDYESALLFYLRYAGGSEL